VRAVGAGVELAAAEVELAGEAAGEQHVAVGRRGERVDRRLRPAEAARPAWSAADVEVGEEERARDFSRAEIGHAVEAASDDYPVGGQRERVAVELCRGAPERARPEVVSGRRVAGQRATAHRLSRAG